MAEYIERESLLERMEGFCKANCGCKHSEDALCESCGMNDAIIYVEDQAAADVFEYPKWISVNERLPEFGIPVLAYYERNAWPDWHNTPVRIKEIGIGLQVDGMWHVDGCSKVVGFAWMPLPELPKEET